MGEDLSALRMGVTPSGEDWPIDEDGKPFDPAPNLTAGLQALDESIALRWASPEAVLSRFPDPDSPMPAGKTDTIKFRRAGSDVAVDMRDLTKPENLSFRHQHEGDAATYYGAYGAYVAGRRSGKTLAQAEFIARARAKTQALREGMAAVFAKDVTSAEDAEFERALAAEGRAVVAEMRAFLDSNPGGASHAPVMTAPSDETLVQALHRMRYDAAKRGPNALDGARWVLGMDTVTRIKTEARDLTNAASSDYACLVTEVLGLPVEIDAANDDRLDLVEAKPRIDWLKYAEPTRVLERWGKATLTGVFDSGRSILGVERLMALEAYQQREYALQQQSDEEGCGAAMAEAKRVYFLSWQA